MEVTENEIRFIDLFSGIGGFRLGLERANYIGGLLPGQETEAVSGDISDSSRGSARVEGNYSLERANSILVHPQSGDNGKETSRVRRSPKTKARNDPSFNGRRCVFRCVWSNDFNKYANQVYTKHFGETNHYSGDIREINAEDIPPHDLLCGGFPCQSFSVAGKRKGFTDTRGTLFFEILRIAEHHRPELLLLENVKGLLSAPLVDEAGDTIPGTHGRVFETILKSLEDLGMWWEYQVLNSKNYGVPQNRERVFIIGHSRKGSTRPIFPITKTSGITDEWNARKQIASTLQHPEHSGGNYRGMNMILDPYNKREKKDGLAGTIKTEQGHPTSMTTAIIEDFYKDRELRVTKDSPTLRGDRIGLKVVQPVLTPDRHEKRQHGRRFKEHNDPMFTLTGQDQHGVLIANTLDQDGYLRRGARNRDENGKSVLTSIGDRRIRRLTPVECERLQGFPDNWTEYGIDNGKQVKISDTQRYKMLGNAVTVNVIDFLGKMIKGSLFGVDPHSWSIRELGECNGQSEPKGTHNDATATNGASPCPTDLSSYHGEGT